MAVLQRTKRIRVHGARFVIKKIDVLNHADGSKVLLQYYNTYKLNTEKPTPESEKKIREHFSHVLVAGLVEPKLSHKEDGNGILVDKLFTDWDLVTQLYTEIMHFTYGKKKVGRSP